MFPQEHGQHRGGLTRSAAPYHSRGRLTRAAATYHDYSYGEFWDPIIARAEAERRRTGNYPFGFRFPSLRQRRPFPRGRYPAGYLSHPRYPRPRYPRPPR